MFDILIVVMDKCLYELELTELYDKKVNLLYVNYTSLSLTLKNEINGENIEQGLYFNCTSIKITLIIHYTF